MLQDHDRDAAKGEKPTEGLALVQILSLQDAPLRRRSGVKRDAGEMDGGDVEDEEDDMVGSSVNGSHIVTPPVATAVANVASVPRTPGGGVCLLVCLVDLSLMDATFSSDAFTSVASLAHLGALRRRGFRPAATARPQGRSHQGRGKFGSVFCRLILNF